MLPLLPLLTPQLGMPQGAEWILVAALVGLPVVVVLGIAAAVLTVLNRRR